MNILYQFNEKYAPYAGVSMTSLFENNKAAKFICVYILGENLSSDSAEKINRLCQEYNREVVFVDTSALVDKMKSINMPTYRGSYAANMRLFVSDIVENVSGDCDRTGVAGRDIKETGVNKVDNRLLYLDADTIVTGDLTQMYTSEIKTLGMVYDTLGCQHKYEIGLEADEGYYNSGVILYDLDKWKNKNFTEKIIDHVINVRAQYPSPDQDLINVVVRDEITPIPFENNFQPHLRDYGYISFMKAFNLSPFYSGSEVSKANANPTIMHAFRYIGEFPWHKGNVHPFNREFDKYLKLSPWSDYIKLPSDSGMVMKIEKILYRLLPKVAFLKIFTMAHRRFYMNANKKSEKNEISKVM